MASLEPKWASQIIKYSKNGELLDNKDVTRKVKIRASRYLFLYDTLYKRSFTLPYSDPIQREGQLCTSRDTRGNTQDLLKRLGNGPQSNQGRILLSLHAKGCRSAHSKV